MVDLNKSMCFTTRVLVGKTIEHFLESAGTVNRVMIGLV